MQFVTYRLIFLSPAYSLYNTSKLNTYIMKEREREWETDRQRDREREREICIYLTLVPLGGGANNAPPPSNFWFFKKNLPNNP